MGKSWISIRQLWRVLVGVFTFFSVVCPCLSSKATTGRESSRHTSSPVTSTLCYGDVEKSMMSPISVRFYLVRHGETVDNNQGLVVGQYDSPLSKLGQSQARALGRSSILAATKFWRHYSSDLGRAVHTATLVLDEKEEALHDGTKSSHEFRLLQDSRIREIAKGARQGFPKSWSYNRAIKERQLTRPDEPIPLLESNDEAWDRLYRFLYQVIREAYVENQTDTDHTGAQKRNILVVSHAGALRLLLHKLAPNSHPALSSNNELDDPSQVPDDNKRLRVPNTSVTILEILVENLDHLKHMIGSEGEAPPISSEQHEKLWTTKVIEFLWVEHLKGLFTANDE